MEAHPYDVPERDPNPPQAGKYSFREDKPGGGLIPFEGPTTAELEQAAYNLGWKAARGTVERELEEYGRIASKQYEGVRDAVYKAGYTDGHEAGVWSVIERLLMGAIALVIVLSAYALVSNPW